MGQTPSVMVPPTRTQRLNAQQPQRFKSEFHRIFRWREAGSIGRTTDLTIQRNLTPSACSAVPPAPLALARGFALYDEDDTATGAYRHTRTHHAL